MSRGVWRSRLAGSLWRLLLLAFGVNFLSSALSIAAGEFDGTGLPPAMMAQEFWANLFCGLGWLVVLGLSFARHSPAAPALAVFLAGAFFFDVATTWPLDMPLPPGFLLWGSAVVGLQLLVARWLARRHGDDGEI